MSRRRPRSTVSAPYSGTVRLSFFGGFEVRDADGTVLDVPGARQRAVLFRLALDTGTTVGYRALAEDVWPDDQPEDPRAALQSLVSRLRRILPPGVLDAAPGGYRLDLAREHVDIDAFADLVARARAEQTPPLARQALALWHGEPWTPDGFDWVVRDLLEDRAHAEKLAAVDDPGRGPADTPLSSSAPATAPDATVPAALTPLVGRRDELVLIDRQLQDARLVTLLGPGGAGKTTLALEIARHRSPAVFVELAPASAGGVWDAVATALGRSIRLSDSPPGVVASSRERALAALAGRSLLVVLDNAEHVIAEAAGVTEEMLRVVGGLQLLTTSREPLGVPGEAFVAVGALPEKDAVALLSARIRAARGADPCVDDAETLARIVRRLDGLPLALELAGARARVLSITEIEKGLDDRFALLDRGPRTAAVRHQTLRAVIDWSWDLLDAPEQTALLAVAVFPDGVGVDDLATVAAAFGVSPATVDGLVDRSLVQRSRGRYRLLETVREYGLGLLRRDGGLDAARDRQAEVMAALALHREPLLRTPDVRAAVAWFDANEENLAAATRWAAADSRRDDTGVLLTRGQLWVWLMRERFDALEPALRRFGEASSSLRSEAEVVIAGFALVLQMFGDLEVAAPEDAVFDRIEAAAARHPSEFTAVMPVMLRAARDAGALRAGGGPWPRGLELDETLAADAPEWSRGLVAVMRAALAQNNGDVATLDDTSARALAVFRRIGDPWGLALASQMRSEWLMLHGRLEEALQISDEASEGLEGLSSLSDLLQQQSLGVLLLVRLGRVPEARVRIAEMAARAGAEGSDRALWQVMTTEASLEVAVGDGEAALRALERVQAWDAAAREAARIPEQVVAWEHARRAQALLLLGTPEPARELLIRAAETAARTGDQPIMADVALALAEWFLADGQRDRSRAALATAERLRGRRDDTDPVALRLRTALDAESGGSDAAASDPPDLLELADLLRPPQALRM